MAKIVNKRFFKSRAPRPPKDPPRDTSPAHMPQHPPHPTHTPRVTQGSTRGTYIVVLDKWVGPVVEEPQSYVAMAIEACLP